MQLNKSRLSKLAGLLTEGHHETTEEVDNATSEDALFDKDPADDPEATTGSGGLSADLTAGYELGAYGIATMSEIAALRRTVLQEMKIMEEGMFDFLKPRGGRWKDATGIEHDDMGGGPGPVPLDRAAHDLAVALADRIDNAAMWLGPESGGSTADYEREGWHKIADSTGKGHWDAVLHTVGPHTAAQAESVLNQWESDGYITRVEPDVLASPGLGRVSGIWLRWRGYEAMKRLRDKSAKSASIQFGTY